MKTTPTARREPGDAPDAIELRGVGARAGGRWILRNIDLTVHAGETFALIGPSGCGKTTLLKTINRLVEPAEGVVLVHGEDFSRADPAVARRSIGYVIQEAGLFANYTVRKNVGVVPELLGWPKAKIRERVRELLTLVGLPDEEYGRRYPSELSGGQRQRVGIARALAADPPVVLLDEPFSALDPVSRGRLQDEFYSLSRKLSKTFVLVTHDIFEAAKLGHRIAVLRDGAIVQCGTPRDIVHNPKDEAVAELMGPHRYQLRLMTTSLGDVGPPPSANASSDARSIAMAPDASLWDALDRMEQEHAEVVHTADRTGARRSLSRQDLLAVGGLP